MANPLHLLTEGRLTREAVDPNLTWNPRTKRWEPVAGIQPGSQAAQQMSHQFSGQAGATPQAQQAIDVAADRRAHYQLPQVQYAQMQRRENARVANARPGSVGNRGNMGGVLPATNYNERLQAENRERIGQGVADTIAAGTSLMPLVGDIADAASTAYFLQSNAAERNPEEGALRMLGSGVPFMTGGMAAGIGALRGVDKVTPHQFLRPGDAPFTNQGIKDAIPQREVGEVGKLKVTKELNDRQAFLLGSKDVVSDTSENVDRLARTQAADYVNAIQKGDSAEAWYGRNILETQALAALKYPELLKNRDDLSALNYAMAVTSNGEDVAQNMRFSMQAFDEYKRTGKFPETFKAQRGDKMANHFRLWNEGEAKHGKSGWIKFLNSKWTAPQLRAMGYSADSIFGTDRMISGSATLGPKIGNAFYQNLEGNFDEFTLDMWMRRDLGMRVGQVLQDNPERMQGAVERLHRAMDTQEGRERIEDALGFEFLPSEHPARKPTQGELNEWTQEMATAVYKQWGQEGHPINVAKEHVTKSGAPIGPRAGHLEDETNRAARELHKLASEPAADFPPELRRLHEQSLYKTVNILREAGVDVTAADLQAVLWGETQGLWRHLGSRTKETTNFAAEMKQFLRGQTDAKGKPITERRLTLAERRGAQSQPSPAATFTPGEQRAFATDILSEQLRDGIRQHLGQGAHGSGLLKRGGARASRHVLAGGERKLPAKAYAGRYTLPTSVSNAFKAHQHSAPPLQEINSTNAAALDVYRAHVKEAQAGRGPLGLSLTVRASPEEYARSRNFMTDDGTAGFSLDGDDIVSVFNTKGGPHKSVSPAMINSAVALGGRRLDAFDIRQFRGKTVSSSLPMHYKRAGMVPVARLKFDKKMADEFAKEQGYPGWPTDELGEPDLVFMAYDPSANGVFDLDKVRYVKDYDAGTRAQKRSLTKTIADLPAPKGRK